MRLHHCLVRFALSFIVLAGAAPARAGEPMELWTQQGGMLTGSDSTADDGFGSRVAASGNTVVVAAVGKIMNSNQYVAGEAYVFTRTGSTWSQQGAPFGATPPLFMNQFGKGVAIEGDTLAISCARCSGATGGNYGAVFVYTRSGGVWTQQQVLHTGTVGTPVDEFGSLAMSGGTIVVGASNRSMGKGAAWVFVRTGTTWSSATALIPADNAVDSYGSSVDISGDTVIVGAPSKTVGTAAKQGAAYIWVRSGSDWSLQTLPARAGAAANDAFGKSVAVSGNTAVVSTATKHFVYTRSGVTWTQNTVLDSLGAVSLSGDTLVNGNVVLARSGNTWVPQGLPLTVAGTMAEDRFASVVAVSGNTLVIASPGKKLNGELNGQGVAHVFTNGPCSGDQDCPSDGYCATGKCLARCKSDADCPTDSYCPGDGVCKPKLEQTAACSVTVGSGCRAAGCSPCISGHCVDGLCCDTACDGTCEACIKAVSAGVDGTCTPIPADRDPQAECPTDAAYPESCGADGYCDGTGACRIYAKKGTACGATSCDAETDTVVGQVCSGGGACGPDSAPCSPYVCGATACKASCAKDADCDATAFCLQGTCVVQQPVGSKCNGPVECASTFCVDGVCCDAACTGQCEACSAEGVCEPVVGEPRGRRTACKGDAAECGGSCDGKNAAKCSFPGSDTVCAQSCSEGEASVATCDSLGACGEPTGEACGAYVCGEDACLTECVGDADCSTGFSCSKGECVGGPQCSPTGNASTLPDGTLEECGAFSCEESSGRCRTECTSIDDCAEGYVCSDSSSCVTQGAGAKSSEASGCGCRVPTGAPSRAALLLGMAGLALAVARRRYKAGARS
ncbi:MAG TPA: FG-GAP repeat protein [Polyangiaceae bacterium]|nr:FG-GAP repeat protein [Polyangiaceae bacterium]